MHGTIAVESQLDHGACFRVSVPLPPAQPGPDRIPVCDLRGKRIFIFSANAESAQIVTSYAQNLGMVAASCATAYDVLDHLHEADQRGERFDTMLIDHCLGGARTLELIERIGIFPAFQDMDFMVVATLGSATATRSLNSSKSPRYLPSLFFRMNSRRRLKYLNRPAAITREPGL